jgi:copper chaperone CopZ
VIMDGQDGQRCAKMSRVTLPIYELGSGGGGALTAERALAKVPGVQRTYVNPLTEMAYVEYDPAVAQLTQLVAAVESVGLRAGEPSLR